MENFWGGFEKRANFMSAMGKTFSRVRAGNMPMNHLTKSVAHASSIGNAAGRVAGAAGGGVMRGVDKAKGLIRGAVPAAAQQAAPAVQQQAPGMLSTIRSHGKAAITGGLVGAGVVYAAQPNQAGYAQPNQAGYAG